MKATQHDPEACDKNKTGRNDQKCAHCQNEIRRATKRRKRGN